MNTTLARTADQDDIRDTSSESLGMRLKLWFARLSGWSLGKRVHFYEALARFVAKGERPVLLLAVWRERFAKRGDPMQHLFARWEEDVRLGYKLPLVLGPWIPSSEATLIAAGEEAGRLDEGLHQAAFVARAAREMRNTVIAGAAYPVMLLLVGIVGLAVIAYRIVPVIDKAAKIPREALPLVSRILFNLGDAVIAFWPYVSVLVLSATVAFVVSLPRWQGPVRRKLDRFGPPWMVYRRYQGAMLVIALAGMIQTGTKLADALRTAASMARPWMRWHIDRMIDRVGEGTSVADSLETGLLDYHTLDMIDAYSRSSSVDAAIVDIGRESIADAVAGVKKAMSAVFVLLLVLVGSMALLSLVGVIYAVMEMALKANVQGMAP